MKHHEQDERESRDENKGKRHELCERGENIPKHDDVNRHEGKVCGGKDEPDPAKEDADDAYHPLPGVRAAAASGEDQGDKDDRRDVHCPLQEVHGLAQVVLAGQLEPDDLFNAVADDQEEHANSTGIRKGKLHRRTWRVH